MRILGLLLIALSLSVLRMPAAEAGFNTCRTDPMISLSDGSTVVITVDIEASVSDLKSIAYVVHVPAGVSMLSYLATPLTGFDGKERVSVVDDAADGQYAADVLVKTTVKGASVTVNMTLQDTGSDGQQAELQTQSADGISGEHIFVALDAAGAD